MCSRIKKLKLTEIQKLLTNLNESDTPQGLKTVFYKLLEGAIFY
jgi:hypothetical protein